MLKNNLQDGETIPNLQMKVQRDNDLHRLIIQQKTF